MGRTRERTPLQLEFGQRVRDRREELGWTIPKLVEESGGMNESYIGQIERGERNIGLRNICRLAGALKVDVGDLMAGLERLV